MHVNIEGERRGGRKIIKEPGSFGGDTQQRQHTYHNNKRISTTPHQSGASAGVKQYDERDRCDGYVFMKEGRTPSRCSPAARVCLRAGNLTSTSFHRPQETSSKNTCGAGGVIQTIFSPPGPLFSDEYQGDLHGLRTHNVSSPCFSFLVSTVFI